MAEFTIALVMEITIKVFDERPNSWHLSAKIDGQKKETVCPKDIFLITYDGYSTILDQIRFIAKGMKDLKDAIKSQDEEKLGKAVVPYFQFFADTTFTGKGARRKLKGGYGRIANSMVNFYDKTYDSMKEKTEAVSLTQKAALALVLSGISFSEIEKAIEDENHYHIEIPITDFTNLDALHTQQSTQTMSILDSSFSLASSAAKLLSGG